MQLVNSCLEGKTICLPIQTSLDHGCPLGICVAWNVWPLIQETHSSNNLRHGIHKIACMSKSKEFLYKIARMSLVRWSFQCPQIRKLTQMSFFLKVEKLQVVVKEPFSYKS